MLFVLECYAGFMQPGTPKHLQSDKSQQQHLIFDLVNMLRTGWNSGQCIPNCARFPPYTFYFLQPLLKKKKKETSDDGV